MLFEGRPQRTDAMAFNMVSGTVRFDAAAMKRGAAVRGEVTLTIVAMRGGQSEPFERK